jgi:hypothetical protein
METHIVPNLFSFLLASSLFRADEMSGTNWKINYKATNSMQLSYLWLDEEKRITLIVHNSRDKERPLLPNSVAMVLP